MGCATCGSCAAVCPTGALELCGERRTTAQLLKTVLADRDFYAASGGGVTLSGGEPLLQAAACAALAAACRAEGLSVLLDTAGNVGYAAFEKVLPHLSECYFDLKAGTQEGYDRVGGRLDLTLENLRRLTADGVKTTARIPVIPGFNDTPAEAARMAQALAGAGVRQIHLLPFHRLGSGKYTALGQAYAYAAAQPPTTDRLKALLAPFTAAGLTAAVKG